MERRRRRRTKRALHIENVKTIIRRMGQAGIPLMGYNFSIAGVSGRTKGNYARGVSMGTPGQAKPDQALLVAIVKTAAGRITLQMYGPNKTVSAQRDNFLKLAKGFRPA